MTDFEQWAGDPTSPLMQDPVNLLELGRAIRATFGERREIELIKRSIVMLMEDGKRPMTRDHGTGAWAWSDRLYVTPDDEISNTPDTAAERAVLRWRAFGTGEVMQFWFGTQLPMKG